MNYNIINFFFLLVIFHNIQVMVYMFDNLQICSPLLFSLCISCKKSASMSHGKEYKRYELIGTLRNVLAAIRMIIDLFFEINITGHIMVFLPNTARKLITDVDISSSCATVLSTKLGIHTY